MAMPLPIKRIPQRGRSLYKRQMSRKETINMEKYKKISVRDPDAYMVGEKTMMNLDAMPAQIRITDSHACCCPRNAR